jgi:hypothetical protein
LKEEKGLDLLSYLAFEPKYLRSLLELGYDDTWAKKHQILEFFDSAPIQYSEPSSPLLEHSPH